MGPIGVKVTRDESVKAFLLKAIEEDRRRFDTDASEEYVAECRWLLSFIDGTLSKQETEYLRSNGVLTADDAANWIGFSLPQEPTPLFTPGIVGNILDAIVSNAARDRKQAGGR